MIGILELAFYSGRNSNIHSLTRILQWAHQRYTFLDSHSAAGALAIYIPGLEFYSGRTSDIHAWTNVLQFAHHRYTFLD